MFKNPFVRFLISTASLAAVWVFLARGTRVIPPLGPLLSPYTGIWARYVSPFEKKENAERLAALGLKAFKRPVEIVVDRDQVKHIFAENDDDLYFAEGFIVASDRIWEMDFLARLASGRLSEVIGSKTLPMDKFFVKIGLEAAAKESADLMLQDPVTGPALKAYVAGVNAFIRTLDPMKLPTEYRLLGYQPEEWTAVKSALIGKFMAFYLSGLSTDLQLTRSRWLLHKTEFDELFPLQTTSLVEPVIPSGTNWSFHPSLPRPPEKEFKPDVKALEPLPLPEFSQEKGKGSNNWAVSGKKSTTGFPILSNDVHLGLQLPSLWYQIQLSSASQNTYGVALIGIPGIMLGFNKNVAWGVTNGYNDILDWYQLRFRDGRNSEYLYGKDWRPVISSEAEIKVRGESPVKITLRRTHFGPVVYEPGEDPSFRRGVPRGMAMRWAALEASNELKTFLLINRARTVQDCRKALETFNTPDQNFLCADSSGAIAIWHMGKYPMKWPGQGRMIADGTSSDFEWRGTIPRDEVPSSKNPSQGFLGSANNPPTDDSYPYYMGSGFMDSFRAARIAEILRSKPKHSPEDLMKMQGDTLSIEARLALPQLLNALKPDGLGEIQREAVEKLKAWDYRFEENSVAASIYTAWFDRFVKRVWAPRFFNDTDYLFPSAERTIEIMRDQPNSKWFDDPKTPQVETLANTATTSFHEAIEELRYAHGKRVEKWNWSRVTPTEFQHLTRVPALARRLDAPGSKNSIYANTGRHGPAWKMVVSLSPERPKAWGVYPGGQSGDPASPFYDPALKAWAKNELEPLMFLSNAGDADAKRDFTVRFQPDGGSR